MYASEIGHYYKKSFPGQNQECVKNCFEADGYLWRG